MGTCCHMEPGAGIIGGGVVGGGKGGSATALAGTASSLLGVRGDLDRRRSRRLRRSRDRDRLSLRLRALAQRGKERTSPGSSPRHCFPTQKIRAPALRAAIYCGKHRIRAPRPGQGALFERPATHSLVTATGSLWHSGTQQAQLFHSQSGSGRHSEVITTWLRGVQKLHTTCTPRKTTRKLTPQYPS